MKDAKGHGSNAHNAGINSLAKVKLHSKVLPIIQKNPNGFSVKPKTGAQPNTGFMVSLPGHTKIVSENDISGPQGKTLIAQFVNEHAVALQQPGAHVGGWTDKDTGKTYLDVSHNISNRADAIRAGRARNQIAIWDVKHSRQIKTGGTGK